MARDVMAENKTVNLPYLDGWRGLAIIAVLVSHFGIHFYRTWMGTFGVQLFFVLSGYLMANLLFIQQVRLPTFFVRRLSRIMPALFVFVTTMAVYYFFRTGQFPRPSEFISTLTFLRTYWPTDVSILESAWPVGNLWSLNVEEHSYIFLAAVAVVARYARRAWFTALLLFLSAAAVLSFVMYYPSHPPAGAAPWYARSECASLGLFAAAAIRVFRQTSPINSMGRFDYWLTLICFSVAILCHTMYQYRDLHHSLAPLLLAIGINFVDRAPQIMRRLLSIGVIRWFGRCSFSMYLWQQPFYIAVIAYEIPNLIGLTLGVAVGAASFYLIEDPARKWINSGGWRAKPIDAKQEPDRLRA